MNSERRGCESMTIRLLVLGSVSIQLHDINPRMEETSLRYEGQVRPRSRASKGGRSYRVSGIRCNWGCWLGHFEFRRRYLTSKATSRLRLNDKKVLFGIY